MRRGLAVALCAFVASGSACCGSSAHPAASAGHLGMKAPIGTQSTTTAPVPTPAPGVDLHSASAVAIAEVTATWTVDTTAEAGWFSGELAATAYMTSSYAASIREHPPIASPGSTWTTWAAHRATTSVVATVEEDPGGPDDSALTAHRNVVAVVTPQGATPSTTQPGQSADQAGSGTTSAGSSWVGPPEIWVTFLVLTRTSLEASWQVAATETAP